MKWIKNVARNYYPLHVSAQLNQEIKGIKFGNIYWKMVKRIIVKYNAPLFYFFSDISIPMDTNLRYFIKEINTEVDYFLSQAENNIDSDLKLMPGDSLEDIEFLYNRYKIELNIMVMGYRFARLIEGMLKDKISKEKIDKIMSPYKKTTIVKENEEIENIKAKKLTDIELRNEAERLAKLYGFVHSEYVGREWDVNDYMDEFKADIRGDKQNKKTFEFDEYTEWLISIAQKCMYFYDEGKAAVVKANWALRKTLEKLGFDEKKILGCTEEEFLEWIKTNKLPDDEILERRNKYYAVLIRDGKFEEYFTKEEIEKMIKEEEIHEFDSVKGDFVKGQVAQKGKVKGKVRVLFSQKDAEDFQKGEILVASMTTPELIKAMRKAVAFVTDEGGIVCHAAIIAREFGVPCVIGTKIATKIFKTGDLVEIDKGVVRKC